MIASQGASQIIKSSDGILAYQQVKNNSSGVTPSPAGGGEGGGINTMSTPRGGQYKLTLPDGTKVWLNAASSITYPIAFSGKTREVRITGEVYFEVAKNKQKPFIVKTHKENITVLGTQFNINSYSDEPFTKTSLIEGSVSINNKILRPGEAYENGIITKTNIARDVAWKNGLFNFDGLDLPAAMRQLARWYDLDIEFEKNIPDKVIRGEMGRDLKLSQVQKILNMMEVKFRLEGRKMIVSP